jgi:hypothetical protein
LSPEAGTKNVDISTVYGSNFQEAVPTQRRSPPAEKCAGFIGAILFSQARNPRKHTLVGAKGRPEAGSSTPQTQMSTP